VKEDPLSTTTPLSTLDLGPAAEPARQQVTSRPSRAWAATGLAAGIAGLAGIQASLAVDAVYDPTLAGDAEGIVERLSTQTVPLIAFHTLTMVSAVLVLVFAAGLRRRLMERLDPGSLLPTVAASGLGLVSVAGLMGSALDTEFIFGVQDPKQMVPEVGVFFGHWIGTVPWLWVGAGLAGVALAVAALKHRAAPRWIGWTSAILGGVTLVFGISPLQYMAGFTGPVWLAVVALGFLVGDTVHRSAGRVA
jgi:hypothetical protein